MAILPIRIYPDPVLRAECRKVEPEELGTPWLRRLVADMVETMHAAPGVGLAAPQVGVERRVAVVDLSVGEDPGSVHVLVNPEVLDPIGSEVDVEGCLSLPGLTDKVERPARVRVKAVDPEGRPVEIEAEEWLARAICHEVDHLDGVLFVDRLRGLRRERMRRQLKRMEEEVHA